MIKVVSRFSFPLASAIFIFLLCFTPAALGQSAVGGSAGIDSIALSQTLPGLLVFGPQTDPRDSDHHDHDGCDARGQDKRSKCTTVPEGGTAFAYLSLVSLGCLAAGIFTIRRQARLRETK
jgi:hypothetical protein